VCWIDRSGRRTGRPHRAPRYHIDSHGHAKTVNAMIECRPGRDRQGTGSQGAGLSWESLQGPLAGRHRTETALRACRQLHINCGRWEARLG